MKLLLVDDHEMFREALALLIAGRFPAVQLLQAASLQQAVGQIAAVSDIDLVLLDLDLTDSSGLSTLSQMRIAFPQARLVVLSADDHPATVEAAIEQGACGFVPKTARGDDLARAVQTILEGGVFVPEGLVASSVSGLGSIDRIQGVVERTVQSSLSTLSPRQMDILRLLVAGQSNKSICRTLGMSPSTAKTHLAEIFRRLGVNNRTQAVVAAARLDLRFPS